MGSAKSYILGEEGPWVVMLERTFDTGYSNFARSRALSQLAQRAVHMDSQLHPWGVKRPSIPKLDALREVVL